MGNAVIWAPRILVFRPWPIKKKSHGQEPFHQSQAETHSTAAKNHESLFRAIDSILQTPSTARGDPIGTLKEIQNNTILVTWLLF
jgi:hypothetical protein